MSDEEYVLVDKESLADAPSDPKTVAKLHAWLQPTDYLGESSEFIRHLNSHVSGTGEWLQETAQYREWHGGDAGALWVKAIAGAGKSVLAARLISHLQATEDETPVLFFFFRQIVTANHSIRSLVQDWLAQLLDYSSFLRTKVNDWTKQKSAVKNLPLDTLWQLLLDTLDSLPKAYCVLDALDEMDSLQTDDLLHKLLELGQRRPSAVKVLVTSRPLPKIQRALRSSVLQVRLEDQNTNKDISFFIRHRLQHAQNVDETTKETIREALENRVHPSFLYARLMLDEILDSRNDKLAQAATLQKTLSSMPASMEDMYSQMLRHHATVVGVPQERQSLILQLVTHSSRPLRLLEVAAVLDFLNTNDAGTLHRGTKDITRVSCGPLLEILEDETVSIIHHSLTEFLTNATRGLRDKTLPIIESAQTNELLATICIKYLLSGVLLSWELRPEDLHSEETSTDDFFYLSWPFEDKQKELQLQYPFLDYALKNWCYHVERVPELGEQMKELLTDFMDSGNHAFLAWIEAIVTLQCAPQSLTPLHIAAWSGMENVVKWLHSTGHDLNTLNSNQETPLHLSARQGHTGVAALLIKNGALPDEANVQGLKPLHLAASLNHHEIIQILLRVGVSPLTPKTEEDPGRRCGNARSTIGTSPLQYVLTGGYLESLRAMLPYLGEEEREDALWDAVRSNEVKLIKLLLETGDINVKSALGGRLLLQSAGKLQLETMELLLKRGADPRYRPENPVKSSRPSNPRLMRQQVDNGSLLLAVCDSAVPTGREPDLPTFQKALKVAFDAGCDVNIKGKDGKTALHYCVARQMSVIDELLEHGADVLARDDDGNTPLHLLKATARSKPILNTLMMAGARWDDTRESDGQTPLHTCLRSAGPDFEFGILEPFLEQWDITDSKGNTALHMAVAGGTLDKYDLKLLLDSLVKIGGDINCKNHEGKTPLHYMCHLGNTRRHIARSESRSIVEDYGGLLIAAGCDIEARDNKGRTLLLTVVLDRLDHAEETLKYIISLDADLQAADDEGNNALHLICGYASFVDCLMLRFLLDAGVEPAHINRKGETLYHFLAPKLLQDGKGNVSSAVEVLKGSGIPFQAQNHNGETLLHCLCSTPPSQLAEDDLSYPKRDEISIIPEAELKKILNIPDYQGFLPIHRAASTSEALVSWLIKKGAGISAGTFQQQTLLHTAAAAKKPNVLGLILDTYNQDDRQDAIHKRDENGRTALHLACVSGRTESVKILLDAGFDVNARDNNGFTPLHVCVESDLGREPISEKSTYLSARKFSNPGLCVAEIIRLLCRYGADITAVDSQHRTPMQLALKLQSEVTILALLEQIESTPEQKEQQLRSVGKLGIGPHAYLEKHLKASRAIIDAETGKDTLRIGAYGTYMRLLNIGAYGALEEIAKQGVSFTYTDEMRTYDFFHSLATLGLTELFDKLGTYRRDTHWINGSTSGRNSAFHNIPPFLLTAVSRELPSLDMIAVIVEKFKADVNVIKYESALHILAKGRHWWQFEAIRYLISRGADVNIADGHGYTPLHRAIGGGYRRFAIVRLLLESGANPNATTTNGTTPLNSADEDTEMVQLLIKYGADISAGSDPIFFRAIEKQDVETVKVILDTGIDCNRPFCDIHPSSDRNDPRLRLRPLQLAALLPTGAHVRTFSTAKACSIIQMLLDCGADPLAPVKDTTVTQSLLSTNAIIEPFLSTPGLNIEQRDGMGRTFLLAVWAQSGIGIRNAEWVRGLESILDITKQLCEMGADLSAVDKQGNTIAHLLVPFSFHSMPSTSEDLASIGNPVEFFKSLIEKCPSILHQPNNAGFKPIHLAAKKQARTTLQMFIAAGADASEPDPDRNTLLHHAAAWGTYASMTKTKTRNLQMALDLGLDINARNNEGHTPIALYAASDIIAPEITKLFEDARASIFTTNSAGEGLLHLLAKKPSSGGDFSPSSSHIFFGRKLDCHPDITLLNYLLERGLDPLLEDCGGRTAIDVASAYGNKNILEIFQDK